MLNQEKMKEQVHKYQLCFIEDSKIVCLIKPKGDVKLSIERAIEWVNAGIDDIDCRSKKEMLEMLNTWLEGGTK